MCGRGDPAHRTPSAEHRPEGPPGSGDCVRAGAPPAAPRVPSRDGQETEGTGTSRPSAASVSVFQTSRGWGCRPGTAPRGRGPRGLRAPAPGRNRRRAGRRDPALELAGAALEVGHGLKQVGLQDDHGDALALMRGRRDRPPRDRRRRRAPGRELVGEHEGVALVAPEGGHAAARRVDGRVGGGISVPVDQGAGRHLLALHLGDPDLGSGNRGGGESMTIGTSSPVGTPMAIGLV